MMRRCLLLLVLLSGYAGAQSLHPSAGARPEAQERLPTGNVVWKTLKKLDGVTDEQRMILLSMIGSMIFPTGDALQSPIPLPRKEITVQALTACTTSDTITVPIWRCDTTSADGCLSPAGDEVTIRNFRMMVREKVEKIFDRLAVRSAYDDMPAVTTTRDDASMPDVLIDFYQDLIAAKYARLDIQRAVTDLRGAMATCLALEVQHLERLLNANLSQALRNSITFSKNLQLCDNGRSHCFSHF